MREKIKLKLNKRKKLKFKEMGLVKPLNDKRCEKAFKEVILPKIVYPAIDNLLYQLDQEIGAYDMGYSSSILQKEVNAIVGNAKDPWSDILDLYYTWMEDTKKKLGIKRNSSG